MVMSTSKCNFSLERAKATWSNSGSRPGKMYKVSQEHLVFPESREAIEDQCGHITKRHKKTRVNLKRLPLTQGDNLASIRIIVTGDWKTPNICKWLSYSNAYNDYNGDDTPFPSSEGHGDGGAPSPSHWSLFYNKAAESVLPTSTKLQEGQSVSRCFCEVETAELLDLQNVVLLRKHQDGFSWC